MFALYKGVEMRFKSTRLSVVLLIFIMILAVTGLPVSAQTEEPTVVPEETAEATDDSVEPSSTITISENCQFDLATVQAILDESQLSFDAGDPETAFSLLDTARDEIDAVYNGCQAIPELVETSVGGVLTFGVPENWVTNATDDDPSDGSLVYIMATDDTALSASMGATPNLLPDQQVVGVLYAAGDEIASLADFGDGEITLDVVVQGMIASLDDDDDALLSQPEPLTVKDWRAQNFRLSLDNSQATAYIVEVDRGQAYVVVIGIGANGRLDSVDAVTHAIVDTLDYDAPVASTAP
jgi:hypothetical protein